MKLKIDRFQDILIKRLQAPDQRKERGRLSEKIKKLDGEKGKQLTNFFLQTLVKSQLKKK